jgi:DNA-binding transcriptional MerR regulator
LAAYSIQDLAHLSGIKPHTIRIWEQRYELIKPKRSSTNIRTYNDLELKKILHISLLLSKGFKISKIAKFTDSQLITELNNHQSTEAEPISTKVQIASIIQAMIEFNEDKFDKTFTDSLIKIGFEQTIIQLIYPFLNKVGLLWSTNKINPAQEHFICNLIRNKLIAAAQHQPFSTNKEGIFILFLPTNEYHELGLLMTNYILKILGFKVIYLGQNVPVDCIIETLNQLPMCNLFTNITFPLADNICVKFADIIKPKNYQHFFVSGNNESIQKLPHKNNLTFIKSIDEFKLLIDSIK